MTTKHFSGLVRGLRLRDETSRWVPGVRLPSGSVTNRAFASLLVGEATISLDDLLGEGLRIELLTQIRCGHCERPTAKSYGGGYCYDCFKSLARCDLCVRSPTRCHFAQGTCREPEWGESFCQQRHWVYLANSSGLKVGLTHREGLPGRWLDQGAVQGLVIAEARTREIAGHLEAAIGESVRDRTDPRLMLQRHSQWRDLSADAAALFVRVAPQWQLLCQRFGEGALRWLGDAPNNETWQVRYPLLDTALVDAESLPLRPGVALNARLMGYKGQYLILDRGVLSIARYRQHEMRIEFGVDAEPVPQQAQLF